MTTSSRYQRAEARHLRDSHPIANARAHNILASQQNPRLKRRIEPIEHDFDPVKYKKARITVEIPARPASHHARPATQSVDARSHAATRHPPNPSSRPAPPVATAATTTVANKPDIASKPHASGQTKHQKKVANGLKYELSKLQPSSADTNDQGGRKLRSQEGTRFKSELSAYFPDYDEVIGNDPKEYHVLNSDTPIIITDADPVSDNKPTSQPPPGPSSRRDQPPHHLGDANTVRGYGDNLFTELWESQEIDFSFLDTGKPLNDPLPDSVFEPAHKKAERLERSIRNAEKGRAQHERDQVIRLLDGLQGHEWLRVMGVSGITESKKRQFEPARAHFIKGCQVILGKFRAWAEEEKRLKLKKERAAAAEAEAERLAEEEDGAQQVAGPSAEEIQDSDAEAAEVSDNDHEDTGSDGDPPDLSDVDASIDKQLQEEVMAAAKTKLKRSRAAAARSAEPKADHPKAFTSFFRKKYQRDAAMSQSRRKGRTVMAFGQPIPEVPEMDFELPDEYLNDDTLKARERRKRRERRGKD